MRDKRHLFFTGIKHSGKTTFARAISEMWGYSFFDSDELMLIKLAGKSVREFYRERGKSAFMSMELDVTKCFIENNASPYVLSLGGGASDNTPLMDTLKSSGSIIYLKRKEEDMLPVILKHGVPAFLDESNIEGSFHELYERRDAIYSRYADLIISLGSYQDIAETKGYIDKTLKENGYGI